MDIVNPYGLRMIYRMGGFVERLRHGEFYKQVEDMIEVGLHR